MGKKIHQNSIIGQEGVNLVERLVLKMGFLWYATPGMEAGIDGVIESRDRITGAVYNKIIQVQSKATEKRFAGETAEKFHYTCDENDLRYWLEGNTPVILVVSRPHTDEAYWVSIKSYFKNPEKRASRKVVFDKKRDRFDEHSAKALMDLTTLRENWQSLQTKFDNLDPYYRLVPSGRGRLSIQAKNPGGVPSPPFEFSFCMTIPNTNEGREMGERYRRHVTSGTELVIPHTYLRDVRMPDFMAQFVDLAGTNQGQIVIGRRPKNDVVEVNVEIECDDGEQAALTNIKLDLVQHGTEEATLNNERQQALWQVDFVWNMKKASAQLDFQSRDGKFNAKQQLEWLLFQRAFSKGGILRMVNAQTGIVAMEQRFPPGSLEPTDDETIDIFEKVLFIQGKTRVPLSVPDEINYEELEEIFNTEQFLRTGRNTLKAKGDWEIHAHPAMARRLLEIYGNSMPARLDWHFGGAVVDLFGAELEIGDADMYCEHTYLNEEDHRALKKFIAGPDPEGAVPVSIKFVENSPVHATYPRWLS